MSTLPQPSGSDFEPIPAGTYPAVCYRVIDLGTQETEYQGDKKKARKILLSWEIADDELRMGDGRPYTISQRFTWSVHEKATFRKTLESWRGVAFKDTDFGENGFNVKKLLNAPCMMTIIEKTDAGKTYSNISAVSKMPKGMITAPLVNSPIYLWLDKYLFDHTAFSMLSDVLKTTIMNSPEFTQATSHKMDNSTNNDHIIDDDIPF